MGWQEEHTRVWCVHPAGCTRCNWCGMSFSPVSQQDPAGYRPGAAPGDERFAAADRDVGVAYELGRRDGKKLGAPIWHPIATVPLEEDVLLWLVTEPNEEASGVVLGRRSAYEEGQFWDGHIYRPLAWCSHWMEKPAPPKRSWKPVGKG